ncbi:hypothetical protein R5R35_013650 [Gryllus longicercus]|uniref:N-acetyltransferase domain-containing protein n=1 Tax=Gryllus longicercus TaxID=2509291 RepID=A0AAN9W1N3_9ORTH
MNDFIIREATRDDCQGILALVQELANFEDMPGGPKIGPDVLQRDGFDVEHPLFKCFVAELKNREQSSNEGNVDTRGLVGYALFYNTYSTWQGPSLYLEDIYVTPNVRSKGIGSALFDKVVKVAYDTGCCRLDFVVLNWNPATEFYKHKGAIDLTATEKWHHYRLEKNAIETLCTKAQES